MARLSRRLESLESRIKPDRPNLILILPYVEPSGPVCGLTATFQGKHYDFTGNDLDELLADAQRLLAPTVTSQCELVSVSVLTQ